MVLTLEKTLKPLHSPRKRFRNSVSLQAIARAWEVGLKWPLLRTTWRSCGRCSCLAAAPDVRTFPTLNAERFYREEKGRSFACYKLLTGRPNRVVRLMNIFQIFATTRLFVALPLFDWMAFTRREFACFGRRSSQTGCFSQFSSVDFTYELRD